MARTRIKKVECQSAPKPVGPYSQAVSAGDHVFVSGQIPINSATGEMVKDGIKEETRVVIDNIEKILSASNLAIENVVKVDVFLKEMEDFSEMNEVYASRFCADVKPARCVVEVSRLPKDARIEMSCVAYRSSEK